MLLTIFYITFPHSKMQLDENPCTIMYMSLWRQATKKCTFSDSDLLHKTKVYHVTFDISSALTIFHRAGDTCDFVYFGSL